MQLKGECILFSSHSDEALLRHQLWDIFLLIVSVPTALFRRKITEFLDEIIVGGRSGEWL